MVFIVLQLLSTSVAFVIDSLEYFWLIMKFGENG